MGLRFVLLSLFVTSRVMAQSPCSQTSLYTPCDIVFELNDAEAATHPNPYLTVDLNVEFRSPRHRTLLMPAFWDGGKRMVIRFAPTEAGDWDYRVSGNLERFASPTGKFQAASSELLGFIKTANVHHFSYTDENKNKPHFWMGDTSLRFAFLDRQLWEQIVDKRAAQKFNHIRGSVIGSEEDSAKIFPRPDQVDPAHFRRLDERILYMNRKGIIADLVLASGRNHLTKLFPTWQLRERYIRYIVGRYAAMNVTWQGVEDFETYENGRALLKEIGLLLKKTDPYQHPRSTYTQRTAAPLLEDGWMDYVAYQSMDSQLGSIEHQLYAVPFVNAKVAYEDSGAGKATGQDVDTDTFRRRIWNAAMDGQYVTYGNTGTSGEGKIPVDARYLDSSGVKQMTAFFEFFSDTRHWDLEPYFDVDGGRALSLEEIEYVVYVEKPGPIEVAVEKHGYDLFWFNPIDGDLQKQKKNFKGEKFVGEPPDTRHDWVLYLSREGKKESMLKSYRFEARRPELQEIEQTPQKVPFEIVEPAADTLSLSKPTPYAAKLKRETRATRSMKWLWTGEVAADGEGYRVLGTGPKGTLNIPAGLVKHFPAVLHLRLTGMNANGKVYSADKIVQLTR